MSDDDANLFISDSFSIGPTPADQFDEPNSPQAANPHNVAMGPCELLHGSRTHSTTAVPELTSSNGCSAKGTTYKEVFPCSF